MLHDGLRSIRTKLDGRWAGKVARLACAGTLLAVPMSTHAASRHKGAKAASTAVPSPAPAQAVPPDPTRPAQQAAAVGLGQCVPILERMGRETLTQTYDLQSGWSRTDPTHHVFQSIVALNNERNVPSDGFAALVAAPSAGGGCDGVSLQVFPLAGDCEAAERTMLKDGRLLAPMLNTRILLDAKGNRIVLMPGAARTCIAIAVDSHFGSP